MILISVCFSVLCIGCSGPKSADTSLPAGESAQAQAPADMDSRTEYTRLSPFEFNSIFNIQPGDKSEYYDDTGLITDTYCEDARRFCLESVVENRGSLILRGVACKLHIGAETVDNRNYVLTEDYYEIEIDKNLSAFACHQGDITDDTGPDTQLISTCKDIFGSFERQDLSRQSFPGNITTINIEGNVFWGTPCVTITWTL